MYLIYELMRGKSFFNLQLTVYSYTASHRVDPSVYLTQSPAYRNPTSYHRIHLRYQLMDQLELPAASPMTCRMDPAETGRRGEDAKFPSPKK